MMGQNKDQEDEITRLNEKVKYLEGKLLAKNSLESSHVNINNNYDMSTYVSIVNPLNATIDADSANRYTNDRQSSRGISPLVRKVISHKSPPSYTPGYLTNKDISMADEDKKLEVVMSENKHAGTAPIHRREKSMLPELKIKETKLDKDKKIGGSAKKDDRRFSVQKYRKGSQPGIFGEWNEDGKVATQLNLSVLERAKIPEPISAHELALLQNRSVRKEPPRRTYKDLNNSFL